MELEIVYHGRKIRVARGVEALPDGRTVERDVVLHPGAVAILPLIDGAQVCLLQNRRPITGETLWEIPAGTLDAGEPPERAAVRELEEETGYRAGRWRKLAEFFPSPGVLNERTHVFVAEELTPGPMRPEPGEDLQPHLVAWSDAVRWAMDGTIRDAKTLIALLLWDRLSRDKT